MNGAGQGLIHDVRFALRGMRRAPGFAITAVLTLALGIGTTTAVFTLVYQVILRSLPVPHPEQLYKVGKDNQCCNESGLQDHWSLFSYDFYRSLRESTPGTKEMAAVEAGSVLFSAYRAGDPGAAQPLAARFVSGNYFSPLGVEPFAGRLMRESDDREGASPVAVLSYTLWRTKFHADPQIIGSTLLLTGHPVTIVGIAAANFSGERNEAGPVGVWLPLTQEPSLEPDRKLLRFPASNWLDLLVRIPDRAQVGAVQLALGNGVHRWLGEHRDMLPVSATDNQIQRQTTELVRASGGINSLRDEYERSLHLLLWIAGFVLLIACANLANLMLVRGMGRQTEVAVRSALGAPRARLIRQTLVEAMLLAVAGGMAALFLAYAGTRAMLALIMKGVEVSPIQAAPSLPIFGFALAVSLATGVIFGLVPAWISSRANPAEALRGVNRSTGDQSALPQRILVILQAALSLVLLTTAGLLLTSPRHLEHQDFLFEPHGRLLVFTDLQAAGYTYPRLGGLYRQMDDAFNRLPGVVRFGYGTYGPMSGDNWSTDIWFPGNDPNANLLASYLSISPDYLATLGTHVLLGRGITADDIATSVHVALVNESFVHAFLKGQSPLGLHFGPIPGYTSAFEIVGVVEDAKYRNPGKPSRPMFFTSIVQTVAFTDARFIANEQAAHYATNLIVQYRGNAATAANQVRGALKSVDPQIPMLKIVPYKDQLSDNFTQEQLVVRLTALFGLIALLLASIGLYGVTAYTVTRRTGEIGIRMPLGASRTGVLTMILRGALRQVALGLAIGVPLSLLAGRLLQHSLYETGSFQPSVLLGVMIFLLTAAAIAALIPARRAAAVEPMQALRT